MDPSSRVCLLLVAGTLLLSPAEAQKPVLSWSAKLGPAMLSISGVAVAADGAVLVVGRTASDVYDTNLFVGKLSADGTTVQCSLELGGRRDDYPYAMALAPDGSLIVAGVTQSEDFPRVPPVPAGSGQSDRTFLLRVNPCDSAPRYSTYLRKGLTAGTLAVASDGSVYLGGWDEDSGNRGVLVHLDISGSAELARTVLRGAPAALAMDAAGSVYASGILPADAKSGRAFAAKLSPDLQKPHYDVTFGDGLLAMSTALALADDGSLYVAAAGALPGSTLVNYSGGYPLPVADDTAATLSRIGPDGDVAFHQFVELPDTSVNGGFRRPVAAGIGPDGRIWIAITGATGFPRTVPQRERVPLNGILLRSFDSNGEAVDGETLIPGLRSYSSLPAVTFTPAGRVAIASVNSYLPVTAGSAMGSAAGGVSTIAFELAGAAEAPALIADRELLDLDSFVLSTKVYRPNKSVQVQATGEASPAFVAAIVPDGGSAVPPRTGPYPAFSTENREGSLPTTITVSAAAEGYDGAALVVLVPGAQGTIAMPIKKRSRRLTTTSEGFSIFLAAPSDQPITGEGRISVLEVNGEAAFHLPFRIQHSTPWLTIEPAEGVTPAEIKITIDPTGLAPGSHGARLSLDIDGAILTPTVTLQIGPLLYTDCCQRPIQVAFGASSITHQFNVQSTGEPMDFTMEPGPGVTLSPMNGRTPQQVTVTANVTGVPVGQRMNSWIRLTANGQLYAVTLEYLVRPAQGIVLPDWLSPGPAAPGSLITFTASQSRCEPAAAQLPPWPTVLGSCTLRVNGQALPLASVTETGVIMGSEYVEPVRAIVTQLPYELEGPTATVEIEDSTGARNALPIPIKPVVPVLKALVGSTPGGTVIRSVGEEVVVRLSGAGATNEPAPWGALPEEAITPRARVEAFVGGRSARIVGAELSRTEVGITEVRFEVPPIAADLHLMNLRIGSEEVPLGSILVR